MKIKPLFETTLAEPFQGVTHHPVGTKMVMNCKIESKRLGSFMWPAASPPHLFLHIAEKSINEAEEFEIALSATNKKVIFAKLPNDKQGCTDEEALRGDIKAEVVNLPSDVLVNQYVDSAITAIVFMVMAV